jgi:hypothetical protein
MSSSRGLGNEVLANQLADALSRRGLRLTALFLLEVGRPIAFVAGQLLWILQPALGFFLESKMIGQYAKLLEDSSGVDALIFRLESIDGLEREET